MAKQLKRRCIIYGIGIFMYICMISATMQYTLADRQKFIMYLAAYLVTGFGTFGALCDRLLMRKLPFDYLMIILATAGALGVGRYMEGVFVMALFEFGMIVEAISTHRTRRSIAEMIDIRPAYAVRKSEEKEIQVDPSELMLDDIIVIRPGERIPVDAVITFGKTTVDTKALTGEARPKTVGKEDKIYSGCINLSGMIEARVVELYKDSTVSRVMKLVEDAQNNKAGSEAFITKFTRIYTPVMFICALLVMLVPPVTFSYGNWDMWIYRGLIFMIVACPCGLVLSVPVAFLGGIASAARQGIVVKGGNYLEDLAKADTFVFDKTGTLTEGVFKVEEVRAMGMSRDELLCMVAHVECYSNHPIAQSLIEAYGGVIDESKVYAMSEMPGFGISATYEGKRVHVGNYKMMEKKQVYADRMDAEGTVVYVGVDKWYAGCIVIRDTVREQAKETLSCLKDKYRAVLVMLTGDAEESALPVARELDMDYAYTNLMPEDKLEQLEDFLFVQDDTERLVCIGDGINDAPVLARADVGIAMGNLGAAAAVEAADIILMEDELPKILDAIHIARETLKVVSQNISFALFVKLLVLLCTIVGYFGMWEAILVEVIVMIVAIMNATWVIKYAA